MVLWALLPEINNADDDDADGRGRHG